MRRHPVVAAVIRVLVVGAFLVAQYHNGLGFGLDDDRRVATLLTVAVVLAALALFTGDDGRGRFPVPTAWTARCVLIGLAILLRHVDTGVTPALMLLWVMVVTAVRYPPAPTLVLGAGAIGALLADGVLTGDVADRLPVILTMCVPALLVLGARERRAARTRAAVTAERLRIARELHDILAHSLSAQIVRLEGARLLLRADRVDEAAEAVDQARELAKHGLTEARDAVAALRADLPPVADTLEAAARRFEADSGRRCHRGVAGDPDRLSPETQVVVTRTLREALTNVVRHAPGADATVTLSVDGGQCVLTVTNPPGDRPGVDGGGYGLVGMRERAELLGGELTAAPTTDGFTVRLRVPV